MMTTMFEYGLLTATLFFLTASSGRVWAAADPSEQDYLQEFPVVLSASRLSQSLSDAPNAMTVIDRKMIVASGFRNIPDLFKLVPGMYVSYYSGNQAVVSYHGAVSQTAPGMQVLLDGRSIYLPPFNIVNWSLLPITIDDIERIEVIRGPAAASYGENSVHGVINIITKDAGELNGKSVTYTHGNKGVNDVATRFGKRGVTFDYRMTLAYTANNGYDNLTTPPNNISLADAQNTGLLNNSNDNNQSRLMNYRSSYHPNNVDEFNAQLGFNHDVMGVGFWDSSIDTPHDMSVYENNQQFEWLHKAGNASELSLRYFHIQHDTNENYLATPLNKSAFLASASVRTGRNEIELQHTLRTSMTNRLVYGVGYRLDQVNVASSNANPNNSPPYLYSSSFGYTEYRVFANDEWRFTPKLIINAGGMQENDGMGNKNFSPRVSLNYHFTPQQTMRVGVSVAYRTPSLGERNSNSADIYQVGYLYEPGPNITSPQLEPEKIVSREIGYLGEFYDLETSVDLRVYSDHMSNLIYPYPHTAPWGNGMTGDYQGVEATIKHSFGESSDLIFNYTNEMVASNSASLPGNPGLLSASLPKSIASLLYSHRLPQNASFSAAYYFQTSMQGFDRGPIDFQPTHRRVDIRLAQSFVGPNGLRGELSGVVQNLFQTDYTEYVATALFNRRAFVKLTIRWQ
jgi:iron complex outermembrane receptor protein